MRAEPCAYVVAVVEHQGMLIGGGRLSCAQYVLEVVVGDIQPCARVAVGEQALARNLRWSIQVDRHNLILCRIGQVSHRLSLALPEIARAIDDALARAQMFAYGAIGLVVDTFSVGPVQILIADVWPIQGELRVVEVYLLVAEPAGNSRPKRGFAREGDAANDDEFWH
ncbi:MAG TPA: hypothetical protein VH393_04950 [Ktedonobacterales bacterium]|jgi:hypothetical protein